MGWGKGVLSVALEKSKVRGRGYLCFDHSDDGLVDENKSAHACVRVSLRGAASGSS